MLRRDHTYLTSTLRQSLLSLSILVCITFDVVAQEVQLPLLKQVKVLQCAESEAKAKVALEAFWDIQDKIGGFPDQHLLKGETSALNAATLDILLNGLVKTATRFPALRSKVERTMLLWNYCDVMQDGVLFDIESDEARVSRSFAAQASPIDWQGFKSIGFFGEVEGRFVPQLLSLEQHSLRADYELLFHRIYREQCFPHPDTSELFDRLENKLSQKLVAVADNATEKVYPYAWDSECISPVNVPVLEANVVINVPLIAVPVLKAQLNIEEVALSVPHLKTAVSISPVEMKVPLLSTLVSISPTALNVPSLKTLVSISPTELKVPSLKTLVSISPTELKVPSLKTVVSISQTELNVPRLQTKVVIEAHEAKVPKLLTKVVVDKPKVVKTAHKPVARNYEGNRGFAHTHTHTNNTNTFVPKTVGGVGHTHNNQAIAVANTLKVVEPKAIVVDKNQAMLERLLAGLSGGSNILIVDKIQLTVNEYNGSVETAISSSDVGNTNSVVPAVSPVSETNQFVKSQFLPDSKPPVVSRVPTVKPVTSKKVNDISIKPIAVPMVESLVFVEARADGSQISTNKLKTLPKPVVIKKKEKFLLHVPQLQTQLRFSSSKPKSVSKSKASVKKTRKTGNGSSSLFIYKPYKNGDKPAPDEKSVEELLQEYAEYEASRLAAKKKEIKTDTSKSQLKSVGSKSGEVSGKDEQRQPDKLSGNTANKRSQAVTVLPLQTQVVIDSGSFAKAQSAQGPIEKVLFSSSNLDKGNKQRYTFSNKASAPPDTAQLTAAATNIPVGLEMDAPVPNVIDETFFSEEPKKGAKKVLDKNKKKPLGFAGNLYLKQSLNESKWAIGGSINRKLIRDDYWFARGGWNYSLENEEDPFSYSWGVGYSDWHPGTFSAQLNNWGPLKIGDGLALDKAVASFGYSVKSEILKKYRLSLSGALNIPIDGNSSASANFRWSPKENWYINSSLSYPLEGDGGPKWTYGFGYSDWRPDKFNLQYSNYGPNELFEPNYRKNGTWSFSYNWKF